MEQDRIHRIGDFLKELHLTEGRNTGFKKILDALEINGSPKPEFETGDDHSYSYNCKYGRYNRCADIYRQEIMAKFCELDILLNV